MNGTAVRCALCSSTALTEFFNRSGTPILCNRQYASRHEAVNAPTADIMLARCERCGGIQNVRFDPLAVVYDEDYENSLHFSRRFQAYSEELAARLAADGCLRGGEVVELGCGHGEFLTLLCRRAGCRGIGYDPALTENGEPNDDGTVSLRKQPYTAADCITDLTRLVVCRHVLEHLAEPAELLKLVRARAASVSGIRFYFEVPNAETMLEHCGLWDVIFEHPLYFTRDSIRALLEISGYVLTSIDLAFDDQFLSVEARIGALREKDTVRMSDLSLSDDTLTRFRREAAAREYHWRRFFERREQSIGPAVLWGVGSKGVSFLNALADPAHIAAAVDLNPRKQGRYVAGSGHRIVAPEALRTIEPDVVLVSNAFYRDEVESDLRALGQNADVLTI